MNLLSNDPLIYIGGCHNLELLEKLMDDNKPFIIFDLQQASHEALKRIRSHVHGIIYIITDNQSGQSM